MHGFGSVDTFPYSYFAVNVIVTIAYLVVEILGEINLGTFIEELMKIITKLVEIVVAVLQLLIKVGVVILNLVKPLLIALLKVWIQYVCLFLTALLLTFFLFSGTSRSSSRLCFGCSYRSSGLYSSFSKPSSWW